MDECYIKILKNNKDTIFIFKILVIIYKFFLKKIVLNFKYYKDNNIPNIYIFIYSLMSLEKAIIINNFLVIYILILKIYFPQSNRIIFK